MFLKRRLESLDLAPIDYHFFRKLDNLLQGEYLTPIGHQNLIDARLNGFFNKNINDLLMKC